LAFVCFVCFVVFPSELSRRRSILAKRTFDILIHDAGWVSAGQLLVIEKPAGIALVELRQMPETVCRAGCSGWFGRLIYARRLG